MRRSLVFVVGFLAACGPPSIDKLCEDIAAAQCAQCYACDVDGGVLCGLPEGTDQSTCEGDIGARCVDQAATLERPKDSLEECDDSLGTLTCDLLVRGAAQDAPHATDACTYFL